MEKEVNSNEAISELTNKEAMAAAGEEITQIEVPVEAIPSMDEFADEINKSFKKMKEGDIITGTVLGVSDTEVTIDLGYYAEGIIKLEELSNDPRFSIKGDITVGETISALIIKEDDGEGNILLSKKRAEDILAWEVLEKAKKDRTIYQVKIAQAVNGGVITYLQGIRAFIPASQLSLNYVENLEDWVGKTLSVVIITVEEAKNKLVLSGKEVEREQAATEKHSKISKLQIGLVTTGTVETITPYGAFVNIGDGLSGLVHISQICGRRIKSPNEILKLSEQVKVKIIDIKDGKISLSIKAVQEKEEILEKIDQAPTEYISGESVSTGLAELLANLKL